MRFRFSTRISGVHQFGKSKTKNTKTTVPDYKLLYAFFLSLKKNQCLWCKLCFCVVLVQSAKEASGVTFVSGTTLRMNKSNVLPLCFVHGASFFFLMHIFFFNQFCIPYFAYLVCVKPKKPICFWFFQANYLVFSFKNPWSTCYFKKRKDERH